MARIVLTADKAIFTDYHGADLFGFGLCLPYRLVPELVQYRILSPGIPVTGLRAKAAPYALCKVEASLIAAGFSRRDVVIVPPRMLPEAVGEDTELVAIHVLDPMGLAPVTWTLKAVSGGGRSCTELEFEKLMRAVRSLKERYGFKVVVGGPGNWQLRGREDRYGIDVLFDGEAELTFPMLVKKLLGGEEVPRYVRGDPAPLDKIPPIITPSRNGLVQITRGCPRRCHFCSPTMWSFRSFPLDIIAKEIEFNLRNGIGRISFITEDVLLYGARGLELNSDAVKKLFKAAADLARRWRVPEKIGFSHVSCSSALLLKDAVKYITEIQGLSEEEPTFPQVGLESGSPKVVAKYFRGKAYPWRPEDWPEVVVESSKLFNDSYWYPCFTYIVGFPDATPDDYVATTELIDRLREEGFVGWVFPLLLIPMGGTIIERRGVGFPSPSLSKLPREAIDCMIAGYKLSIANSKKLANRVISVRNPLLAKIFHNLASRAIDAMEYWISGVEKDLDVIESEYSKFSIRSTRELAKAVLPMIARRAV